MSNEKTIVSSTPYDDVFKTLLIDCGKLIIPVINEVFGGTLSGGRKNHPGSK